MIDRKGSVVLASALVEYCLHPRALLSPMDADYCAQVIKIIHSLGTPGFSTLNTYNMVRVSLMDNKGKFNLLI
jgi:hypothetical protein